MKGTYRKLRRLSNTGELEIWLQRITYHMNDEDNDFKEPLAQIVMSNEVQMWNNNWLKVELLEGFPLLCLCDVVKRDAQTLIITAREASYFDY